MLAGMGGSVDVFRMVIYQFLYIYSYFLFTYPNLILLKWVTLFSATVVVLIMQSLPEIDMLYQKASSKVKSATAF